MSDQAKGYEELKASFTALTPKQQKWVKVKAGWEAMPYLAVLNDWTPPADTELAPCGAYGKCDCRDCEEATT